MRLLQEVGLLQRGVERELNSVLKSTISGSRYRRHATERRSLGEAAGLRTTCN